MGIRTSGPRCGAGLLRDRSFCLSVPVSERTIMVLGKPYSKGAASSPRMEVMCFNRAARCPSFDSMFNPSGLVWDTQQSGHWKRKAQRWGWADRKYFKIGNGATRVQVSRAVCIILNTRQNKVHFVTQFPPPAGA